MKAELDLLDQRLVHNFDSWFCEQAEHMGFSCLRDILAAETSLLIQQEYFTYTWLAELTRFLSRRKLIYLLQPIPGNTPS
jgi:hypothetical protein